MFNNILIATDNSKAVHHAISYTVHLFPNASFHIVSVINTSDRSVPLTELIMDEMRVSAEKAVENAKALLISRGARCVETAIRTGTPSREVVKHIAENNIDLLAITRTAKECSPHIGATCLHILELVHCPVLIVPANTPLKRPENVLNTTGGSKYSLSASEMAVLLADTFKVPLFSLYVGEGNGELALGAVESLAEKLDVPFNCRIATHPKDRDILRCARSYDIMVFSRGYAGIRYKLSRLKKKMILGKLDREVIGDADIPLLIVGD